MCLATWRVENINKSDMRGDSQAHSPAISALNGHQGPGEAPAMEQDIQEGNLGSASNELCDLRKVSFPFWASDMRFNEGSPNRSMME